MTEKLKILKALTLLIRKLELSSHGASFVVFSNKDIHTNKLIRETFDNLEKAFYFFEKTRVQSSFLALQANDIVIARKYKQDYTIPSSSVDYKENWIWMSASGGWIDDQNIQPVENMLEKPNGAVMSNQTNVKEAEVVSIPSVSQPPVNDGIMPHNNQAEQALLGILLVNNDAFDKIGESLKPNHFYDPAHGRIFDAIQTFVSRGQLADVKTLKELFDNDPALTSVGGSKYLVDLAGGFFSHLGVSDYARTIRDLYLRRKLVELSSDITSSATTFTLESDATNLIENIEKSLFDLSSSGVPERGFIKLGKSLLQSLAMADQAYKNINHITGVPTCLRDLDNKLGGLQKSDLIILAGRPSMGKTALATNMAFNAAEAFLESNGEQGCSVAFFSLEMSSEQLTTRILGENAGIPSDRIRRGDLQKDDFFKMAEASKTLSAVPLYIDDTPGLCVSALRTRARRLKRRAPDLGLIVVDYLQLLAGDGRGRGGENRVQEISEITRGLKCIAKELNVPVLALSQLSRNVESREDKRPMLSDLRESGSIEQDADVVLFVYREEYYHSRSEPSIRPDESESKFIERLEKWKVKGEQVANVAEVIISKQRHGPIGTVELHFDGSLTKFGDLATDRFGR